MTRAVLLHRFGSRSASLDRRLHIAGRAEDLEDRTEHIVPLDLDHRHIGRFGHRIASDHAGGPAVGLEDPDRRETVFVPQSPSGLIGQRTSHRFGFSGVKCYGGSVQESTHGKGPLEARLVRELLMSKRQVIFLFPAPSQGLLRSPVPELRTPEPPSRYSWNP